MNYPNYYYPTQYVQPVYQPQIPMQSQQASQAQNPQAKQVQNTGFIMVRSEEEAYNYPVAPGNCVSFKVENEPIVIEKSMSYSQLETPRIDRYRLVREDIVEPPAIIDSMEVSHTASDELKTELMDELQTIRHEIEGIKKKLDRPQPTNNNVKKGEGGKNE